MPKPTELDIVLVRSGDTEWDDAGRLVGSADLPLSASGRAELTTILGSLDDDEFAAVLCGPDESSRATAELVASRGGAKVKPLDKLSEMGLGLWEGLLTSDVEDRYPTAYRQWLENPAGVSIPEGEPMHECRERVLSAVCKAIEKCKLSEGKPVAIVLRPFAMSILGHWLAASNTDARPVVSEITGAAPIARYRLNRAEMKAQMKADFEPSEMRAAV